MSVMDEVHKVRSRVRRELEPYLDRLINWPHQKQIDAVRKENSRRMDPYLKRLVRR